MRRAVSSSVALRAMALVRLLLIFCPSIPSSSDASLSSPSVRGSLVLLAALCLERRPEQVADEIGGAGAAALKSLVTDALNERLRPIRTRHRELAKDLAYLRHVLAAGNDRARDVAADTLRTVQELMHTTY